MEKSRVTEYIIHYLCINRISTAQISEITGIPEAKLKAGYTEPLLADEFLQLCVLLDLKPETVADAIHL